MLLFAAVLVAQPAAPTVRFWPPAEPVGVYEAYEVTAVPSPKVADRPFAPRLSGTVTGPDAVAVPVAGFCDAADGSVYRIRFMPARPGRHTYALSFAAHNAAWQHKGTFDAAPSNRKGPVRIDPKYPHHFVWEGTGEHYFWNGTTTYWLLGVQDDKRIEAAIDRLAKLKVNRIRVAVNARTTSAERWYEPVRNSDAFKFRVNPWPAKNPDSPTDPQLDVSRFDVALWQKLDRLVKHARDKDVVVSVIFHLDGADKGVDPFGQGKKDWPGSEDEWRYYRYAAARLSAYSNVMWDITNEWHLFRNEAWVNKAGDVLRAADPYKHLMSVHGRGDYPFYKSPWSDFAMYQVWDEAGGYKFLRRARELAAKAGKPMPQVNEEYGYEDHYPGKWGGGRKAPARSADNRRRLAWEMSMAGGYQTTGERANIPTQGGWITGLGDDSMVMLAGYAKMVDFFTAFEWWKCDPQAGPGMVLAEPGRQYAVYLPKGGSVKLDVPAGKFRGRWYNPRTGEWSPATPTNGEYTAPDADDWALLVVADP
ncbi:MAG: DUF5060 domain-containing protein [Gemmataceae bacterium]